jgi:hypothetical protein
MPTPKMVKEVVSANVLTDTVAYWAVAYVFHKLLSVPRADEKPRAFALEAADAEKNADEAVAASGAITSTSTTAEDEKKTFSTSGKGWSYLRFNGPMPSAFTTAWQVCNSWSPFSSSQAFLLSS